MLGLVFLSFWNPIIGIFRSCSSERRVPCAVVLSQLGRAVRSRAAAAVPLCPAPSPRPRGAGTVLAAAPGAGVAASAESASQGEVGCTRGTSASQLGRLTGAFPAAAITLSVSDTFPGISPRLSVSWVLP